MSRRRKPFTDGEEIEFQHDVGMPWQKGKILGRSDVGRTFYIVVGPAFEVFIDGVYRGKITRRNIPAQRIRRIGEQWGSYRKDG